MAPRLPRSQVATANSPPPPFVYNESEELQSPEPCSDDPIMSKVGLAGMAMIPIIVRLSSCLRIIEDSSAAPTTKKSG
jgi:hypothetical protein